MLLALILQNKIFLNILDIPLKENLLNFILILKG